ncbi:hypothetical protein [Flavobacterium sp.]|uniref:hypothetical protein n=1 Tax=Flavobacterium sp. TaxID=239 RepID=UPI002620C106|nr:hypothetical protein [Flavobacterium sp.]MDD3003546.1 hypothetical protein [Flavobacterium sp.]
MKKAFLLFFSLFSLMSFSQQINDYEFVMIPTQFDFQRSENEYRLNTLLKYRLEEYGFKTMYTTDQMNTNFNDRCKYLNVELVNESGVFLTKLHIVFKNCDNVVVYKSVTGSSKTKERKVAFKEALEEALKSVQALQYKYSGTSTNSSLTQTINPTEITSQNALFAQPISNGFQLVDTTPKVILKMYKTSQTDIFIANREGVNGLVVKKNGNWFFEFYQKDQLVSEQLAIKF